MSRVPPTSASATIDDVARRLARIAARERWRGVGQMVAVSLWAMVSLFAIDVLTDYCFEPERVARRMLLAALTMVALSVTLRFAIRVARRTMSLEQLAGQAEREFPSLRGQLRSALAWRSMADGGDARGLSWELMKATCEAAARSAQEVDFARLGDNGVARRGWWSFAAAAGCLLIAIFCVSQTTWGGVWWSRNVLGHDVAWPSVVRIELEGVKDGRLVVARGATVRIPVSVSAIDERMAPTPEVTLAPARSRTLLAVPGRTGSYRLEVRDVYEPFTFRVTAGDGRTAWIPVQLVDPPRVLELTLAATLPEYLGGESRELPSDQGTYRLPRGSRLHVSGLANKPLNSAWALTSRGEWPMAVEPAAESQRASPSASPDHIQETITRRFQRDLSPSELGDGLITIGVRDVDQLELPRPLAIRLDWLDDQLPRVAAKWSGGGRWIVPTTRIDWNATVTDDHAVVDVMVRARVTDAEGKEVGPWKVIHTEARRDVPPASVEASARLSLESLGLVPGQTVTLVVEATDNDAFAGPKSGRSSERVMRVVGSDELRADWQRRDKEQRLQLEQTWRDWRDEIEQFSKGETPVRSFIVQSRQARSTLQAALEARLEPLAEIVGEMLASGLESSASPLVERREARIMEPLRRLARETPDEVARALAWPAGTEGWPAARDEAVRRERQSLDTLQRVTRELNREEGFQEAVRLLEELSTGQETLLRETMEARQRRVRELLERKEAGAEAPKGNGANQ